jgi:8-oxo-dGTP diphosphatase
MTDFTKYIDHVSIDCVVFGYQAKKLKVLISKVAFAKNGFALLGGFINLDEDIDDAATRILKDRTSLDHIYLEQFKVFGKKNRFDKFFLQQIEKNLISNLNKDSILIDTQWLNKRFISLGYYALVDIEKVAPRKSEIDEKLEWIPIDEVPKLIFDHNEIIAEALVALRDNLDKKLIGFNLLPPTFTMKDLQELYEAVYDMPFARNNFQKKMLDINVLERLEKKFTGAANKAPYLYRFKK